MKKKMTTRQMAVAGMMGAIAIILGATGLGMFPIPNLTGRATIMHVPVILAAVLEGPVVGGFTGLIFGMYSFLTPKTAFSLGYGRHHRHLNQHCRLFGLGCLI